VMFLAGVISRFDKIIIDGLIDSLARGTVQISKLDDMFDRYFIDGLVNLTAHWTYSIGTSLRRVQTGKLRQYVMLIVIGTVALTVLIKWSAAAAP
jgi:NADH-quinone oxidoreductase subunit L